MDKGECEVKIIFYVWTVCFSLSYYGYVINRLGWDSLIAFGLSLAAATCEAVAENAKD
jgi:cytochrome c oxidase subunit IV